MESAASRFAHSSTGGIQMQMSCFVDYRPALIETPVPPVTLPPAVPAVSPSTPKPTPGPEPQPPLPEPASDPAPAPLPEPIPA
jgi:hypothetical protein